MSRLSSAEISVLCCIADGMSDLQAATFLRRSVHTIHRHRDNLFIKTGSHNRVELARYAVARGYVPATWKNGANEG